MTLELHLPLAEDEGSTAFDHSGNGRDGTITGAGPAGTGTEDGPGPQSAFSFDGSDDVVETSTSVAPKTISIWFKAENSFTGGSESPQNLIGSNNNSVNVALGDWTGFISGESIILADPPSSEITGWGPDINAGDWNHAVFIADGTGAELYFNGELEDPVGTRNGGVTSLTSGDVDIGSRGDGTNFFEGAVAEVRYYSRALTASEILQLYNSYVQGSAVTQEITIDEPTDDPTLVATARIEGTSSITATVTNEDGEVSDTLNIQSSSTDQRYNTTGLTETQSTYYARFNFTAAQPTDTVEIDTASLDQPQQQQISVSTAIASVSTFQRALTQGNSIYSQSTQTATLEGGSFPQTGSYSSAVFSANTTVYRIFRRYFVAEVDQNIDILQDTDSSYDSDAPTISIEDLQPDLVSEFEQAPLEVPLEVEQIDPETIFGRGLSPNLTFEDLQRQDKEFTFAELQITPNALNFFNDEFPQAAATITITELFPTDSTFEQSFVDANTRSRVFIAEPPPILRPVNNQLNELFPQPDTNELALAEGVIESDNEKIIDSHEQSPATTAFEDLTPTADETGPIAPLSVPLDAGDDTTDEIYAPAAFPNVILTSYAWIDVSELGGIGFSVGVGNINIGKDDFSVE